MADMIIDGIRCRSFVHNLRTGETKPYDKSMEHDLTCSILSCMTPEELSALPKSKSEREPDFHVFIKDGRITVKDHENTSRNTA